MSLFVSSQDSAYNKQRCEELRLIRKDLAEKLGVGYKVRSTPCMFKGKCKGTCPACEAEERVLLDELYKLDYKRNIKIEFRDMPKRFNPNPFDIVYRTLGVPAPKNNHNDAISNIAHIDTDNNGFGDVPITEGDILDSYWDLENTDKHGISEPEIKQELHESRVSDEEYDCGRTMGSIRMPSDYIDLTPDTKYKSESNQRPEFGPMLSGMPAPPPDNSHKWKKKDIFKK